MKHAANARGKAVGIGMEKAREQDPHLKQPSIMAVRIPGLGSRLRDVPIQKERSSGKGHENRGRG